MKPSDDQTSRSAEPLQAVCSHPGRSWTILSCCVRWGTAALLAAAVGSWMVWFAAYIQRQQNEEDIRAACRHVMPEAAERCFDTVVIQRGGVRR